MTIINTEFRIFKDAHHNGQEFIEQAQLSSHITNEESIKTLKEMIKESHDDFAHEDFFITKWELIENEYKERNWKENLKFGRQKSNFKKNGKGLLFTRKEYNEFEVE